MLCVIYLVWEKLEAEHRTCAKPLHRYDSFGYDQRIKITVLMISYTSAMTPLAISNCENHKMSEQNFLFYKEVE